MDIFTIELIHTLLIREEKDTNSRYNEARRLLCKFEKADDPDQAPISSQREAVDILMTEHSNALQALHDFEEHGWH